MSSTSPFAFGFSLDEPGSSDADADADGRERQHQQNDGVQDERRGRHRGRADDETAVQERMRQCGRRLRDGSDGESAGGSSRQRRFRWLSTRDLVSRVVGKCSETGIPYEYFVIRPARRRGAASGDGCGGGDDNTDGCAAEKTSTKDTQDDNEGAAMAGVNNVPAVSIKYVLLSPSWEPQEEDEKEEEEGGVGGFVASYEGGGSVWECSVDLVKYLSDMVACDADCETADESASSATARSAIWRWIEQRRDGDGEDAEGGDGRGEPSRLLELGCGHALPSCFLLRQRQQRRRRHKHNEDLLLELPSSADAGQRRSAQSSFLKSAVLVDYHRNVLENTTVPNLILNLEAPTSAATTNDDSHADAAAAAVASVLDTIVTLGSGDWLEMSNSMLQLQQKQQQEEASASFGIILASETCYSREAARDTAYLVSRHLSSRGAALVATKRYYFGVGGGTQAFLDEVAAIDNNDGDCRSSRKRLLVETVRVLDNGRGNIREILQVTWQRK